MFIFHVGRHKCGSTSIQRILSDNAGRLREYDIMYPTVARPGNAHHLLARNLKSGKSDDLDEIIELKKRHPGQKIVLSSEGLGTLPLPQINRLRDRIGASETLIVIYMRDLIGWLPSKYNEATKVGSNTADFDQFYNEEQLSNSLYASWYCEQWASVFGWHNLRIRSLDSRSLSGGTLITDFLSIFGLVLADLGDQEAPGLELRNTSFGWKVLEVLRAQFARFKAHPDAIPVTWEVGARIRNLAVRLLTNMGLNGQYTQYLSAGQCLEADQTYRLELEKLNRQIVGPKLPLPERPVVTDRPFLPTLQQIPLDERIELARRMEFNLLGKGAASGGAWHQQFDQAGIGTELRRCIIDALASDANMNLLPSSSLSWRHGPRHVR